MPDYTYPLINACLGRCPKTGVILGKLDFENEHGHRLATVHEVMIAYRKNEEGEITSAFMTDGELGLRDGEMERFDKVAELYGSNYPGWQEHLEGEEESNLIQAVKDLLSMESKRFSLIQPVNDISLLEE